MLKWHFKKLSCESIGRRWVHAFTVNNMVRQVARPANTTIRKLLLYFMNKSKQILFEL
jgi:hypothetical protein